jgi:hypothetical protein
MKRIVQANIDRFKQLLETTTDPTKRKTLLHLLAEEEAKLANMAAPPSLGKTAN